MFSCSPKGPRIPYGSWVVESLRANDFFFYYSLKLHKYVSIIVDPKVTVIRYKINKNRLTNLNYIKTESSTPKSENDLGFL